MSQYIQDEHISVKERLQNKSGKKKSNTTFYKIK
jgi:hypothetical protein